MQLKLLQKQAIQKTVEETSDVIGNKNVDKITKVSKSSPRNNLEIVESETAHKYQKKDITPEKKIANC